MDLKFGKSNFVYRIKFIIDLCKSKSVLSLGCGEYPLTEQNIKRDEHIHLKLNELSNDVYGVEMDINSVEILRNKYKIKNIFLGNVEKLNDIPISKIFDVILAGDIIEHLDCPGLMLEGIKKFMDNNSILIISTNNAYSIPANMRYFIGKNPDSKNHLCIFSKSTLLNILDKRGFRIENICGAYDHKPKGIINKLLFYLGLVFLKLKPLSAGTLIVVAKLK